jgi:hemolysin III
VFRKLDHCSIYLLIAGTYTPFTLVSLRGTWGWSLLGVIWGLAVIGIVQEVWQGKGARIASLLIYVLMGWLGVIAFNPLLAALTPAGFAWLGVGGLIYTVGIIFYALDETLRHGHGIWHLFVLAGSACHFLAILLYVA